MSYNENYEQWLNDPRLDEESRAELLAIKDDEKEKEYRFGGELEFGTAGMRGIIGCGMNMMNIYTVMRASEGLSRYISSLGEEAKKRGVVIDLFAEFFKKSFQKFHGTRAVRFSG